MNGRSSNKNLSNKFQVLFHLTITFDRFLTLKTAVWGRVVVEGRRHLRPLKAHGRGRKAGTARQKAVTSHYCRFGLSWNQPHWVLSLDLCCWSQQKLSRFMIQLSVVGASPLEQQQQQLSKRRWSSSCLLLMLLLRPFLRPGRLLLCTAAIKLQLVSKDKLLLCDWRTWVTVDIW